MLLFMHHIPYTQPLKSGKTVIQFLYDSHYEGADAVAKYVDEWRALKGLVDAERYDKVHAHCDVLVVGGGDSAVEAAVGLAHQPGNEVTLSYRRDKLVRIKKKNEERLAPLLSSGRIKPLFGSQVAEVTPDRVRLKVGTEVQELENDYVFVFAGGEPPFEFLKQCGVRFGGEEAQAS